MFDHPNDYDDWLLSDDTEADRPLCEACDGTGRLCLICLKPQDQCECHESADAASEKTQLEPDTDISGYDAVICNACNGSGFMRRSNEQSTGS